MIIQAIHNTLPFTSLTFAMFMVIVIALFLFFKWMNAKQNAYKWLLFFFNLFYLTILFPKPLQIILLIVYLYLAVLLLRRFYTSENVVLPMIILALPMIYMKYINAQPASGDDGSFLTESRKIIQIAGLSYMIFKVIGLYIDERRTAGKISFVHFFNFTAFVPALLIGPIDRYARFREDCIKGFENISISLYQKAWNRLVLGLLFKFIIAEFIHRMLLSHVVNDGTFIYHVSYMYTYLFYLFFDFAGYSLLAISFGNFIGIHVPVNFDKPFLAVNPKEFWKRWHKSLGDWLNDYFFKPIFKFLTTKKWFNSIQRQSVALFLTFALMGFWNGFELHFVISGMLFGVYSVIHNYYQHKCKVKGKDVFFGSASPVVVKYLSLFLMINSVAFAIYIFSGKLF